MEDEDKMDITHMEQSGLIAVSMYGQTVELCIEDIREINRLVKRVGTSRIAKKEDFL